MAAFINTNIASLNSQRALSGSQGALQTSLQRLSSVLRINSAKDDAAGLAISERMTSQIKGLNQAARNANDGISMAQTAEGDLVQIGNNLQRMRELAVQSANATNSSSDRSALNEELNQLKAEIDRVSVNSSFNGVKLLDGSFSKQDFQVGANNTQVDRVQIDSIASSRTSALGQGNGATITTTALAAGTGITAAGQFTIGVNGGTAVDVFSASGGAAVGGNARDIAAAINKSNITGLTATANATSATGTYAATGAGFNANGNVTLGINGTNITVGVTSAGGAANVTAAHAAIQANSAATGVTASIEAGNTLKLTAADGRNIAFTFTDTGTTGSAAADLGLGGVTTAYGSYNLSYEGEGAVVVAGSAAANVKGVADGTTNSQKTGTAVSELNISTVDGAKKAIDSIDNALKSVNSSRASLGAIQNRFTSVISSLQATSENLSASRSRIQDADFAAETATLTRGQILQQAGTAMLAQANSLPNGVLALLRG